MHCKVPFLAAVLTSQLSYFHFKIFIFPINLQCTNKISISQLIFYIWDWNHKRLLTSHIVVTSDINNRMVQNFGILDWNRFFFKNPSQILWTNCFFFFFSNFLHEMVSFTHQEFVQGTCYHVWRFTDQVKEHVKRAFEHLVNGVKHYVSTRTHHIYTRLMCIHSLTWLSNNLNMLRANRIFDIIQLMQTKLGTSIICIQHYKAANPCVKLIE
jgi:hypothetical protein